MKIYKNINTIKNTQIIIFINRVLWPFKNFFCNIKRLFIWLPVIWKDREFDYQFLLNIMIFKLKQMEKYHMRSEILMSDDKKRILSGLRTSINLLEKTYDDTYAMEYLNEIERRFGKENLIFEACKDIPNAHELVYKFDKPYTDDELIDIDKIKSELFIRSKVKQEKAERITFSFISHRIREWWD
jgi:hypothetical protein